MNTWWRRLHRSGTRDSYVLSIVRRDAMNVGAIGPVGGSGAVYALSPFLNGVRRTSDAATAAAAQLDAAAAATRATQAAAAARAQAAADYPGCPAFRKSRDRANCPERSALHNLDAIRYHRAGKRNAGCHGPSRCDARRGNRRRHGIERDGRSRGAAIAHGFGPVRRQRRNGAGLWRGGLDRTAVSLRAHLRPARCPRHPARCPRIAIPTHRTDYLRVRQIRPRTST